MSHLRGHGNPTKDNEQIPLPSSDDPEVLNSRDKVILNALPPKSAPASSLKAVLNGCLGEVALLKPLPTPAVTMSLLRMGLTARLVQKLLLRIALESTAVLRCVRQVQQKRSRVKSWEKG